MHRLLNLLVPLLLAGSLLAAPAAAAGRPAEASQRLPIERSLVEYPLQVGDYRFVEEHVYEPGALGVSLNYASEAHPRTRIDLYFYPVGSITLEWLRQQAEGELEGIRRYGRDSGAYRDVRVGELETHRLAVGPAGPEGERVSAEGVLAVMEIETPESVNHSVYALFPYHLYLVKLRMSEPHERADFDGFRERALGFLRAALVESEVLSTGGCWRELPIERIEPGQAWPEGMLISSARSDAAGGESQIVAAAYPERILALDPDGLEAGMMRALAAGILQRASPGCVAPERLERAAAEGHGQLRLEFLPEDFQP